MVRYNGIEIDMAARTIAHGGKTHKFYPCQRSFEKVCYFVLGGGVSFEMAFTQFYGHDAEGGPDRGPQTFAVLLNQYQHSFLDRLQLEWRAYIIAGVSFYEIVSKHEARPPQRFARSRQRGGQAIPWVRWKKNDDTLSVLQT